MTKEETLSILKQIKGNKKYTDYEIRKFCEWRNKHLYAFWDDKPTTFYRTKRWLQEQVINNPERLLYRIYYNGRMIGHGGLATFDFDNESCEIDNIVRGEEGGPGTMTRFVLAMIKLAKKKFNAKNIYLRVRVDNDRAIQFYKNIGFVEVERVPYEKGDYIRMKYENTRQQ